MTGKVMHTLGIINGQKALHYIKRIKNAGYKKITITTPNTDVMEISCIHPKDAELTNFKFDFENKRAYQTNNFFTTTLLPWNRKHKIMMKQVASLSTDRLLGTISQDITIDNGIATADEKILQSYTSGNKYKRVVNTAGKIEYFKLVANGQYKKLFG